jgi:methyltransferase
MRLRLLICAGMAAARLIELTFSKRNIQRSPAAGVDTNQRLYPVMVALHTAVIGGTLLKGRSRPHLPWLVALLLAQPLRYWVLSSLGSRWNSRGVVSPVLVVETGGPYAYIRHPNYTVVAVELAALPAAFGLGRLALAASAVNAALMVVRVRDEERLLFALPGYAEHFRAKKRFIPGIF